MPAWPIRISNCWHRQSCVLRSALGRLTWVESVTVRNTVIGTALNVDTDFHCCTGCLGECYSKSSCTFLHKLHDTAVKKMHCQACLMPLRRVQGENLHPSGPGWRQCEFKNRDCVRKFLVLASQGVDIKVVLPAHFPRTGPEDAMLWAFEAGPASPKVV